MKRWKASAGDDAEDEKIDAFLAEVWAVCEKHGLALSHEDRHGAFIVVSLEDGDKEWLMKAFDGT